MSPDENSTEQTASILCLFAPTLEPLVWDFPHADEELGALTARPWPGFVSLRNLRFSEQYKAADGMVIDAFLNPRLVKLSISSSDRRLYDALDRHGQIPSLETTAIQLNVPLGFLQANPHLSELDFGDSEFPTEHLEKDLIPLLPAFSNLTSLRIAWPFGTGVVPEDALRIIGNLHSLPALYKVW